MYLMRFAMRTSSDDPAARADSYRTALEMAEWADTRGCMSAIVSQHHGSDDGYLPSPIPLAAALAARTTNMRISVSALLLALYEPVKLAEDMAVLDLISRGRVSYVIGIGYRDEEFAAFGVDRRVRAQLVEDRIQLLRRLWSGDTVEFAGRTARVTPAPYTRGGPMLAYGGGSPAAARRAGRLGMYFIADAADPSLEAVYRESAAAAGVKPRGCVLQPTDVPLTVFVAEDPDRAWAEIGEYLLMDAVGYQRWKAKRGATITTSHARTVDELRAERGAYQIVTPDEAYALVARGAALSLQPIVGGIPAEIAWPYLESAVAAATGRVRGGGAIDN
ncbi:MAG: hypothetical protein QOH89_1853 [Pseudonocardiales bacterium]|nr:hypothetical protein [Pseudonocardiales bacterium]